jgi:hypothetical protein
VNLHNRHNIIMKIAYIDIILCIWIIIMNICWEEGVKL